MGRRIILTLFASLVLNAGISYGVPAWRGVYTIIQPDGSSFKAMLRGDEYSRILTTDDGCALTMDSDGFYQYAFYNADGTKTKSGYRPASDNVPGMVMAESRNIPYSVLRRRAMELRRSMARPVSRRKTLPGVRADAIEKRHVLVLLVQFPDLEFRSADRKQDFTEMICAEGYSKDGATGSVKDYFHDQIGGCMDFDFDISDIITVSRSYKYYGADDERTDFDSHPDELTLEACMLADPMIDFSKYDDDGDGEVDNIFVIAAGLNQAEGADPDYIWPHQWSVQREVTLDGKRLGCYAMVTEMNVSSRRADGQVSWGMATIGTFCHEFSHIIGLSDLYDTDDEKSEGLSEGLWYSTALMDGGSYNNVGKTPAGYNAIDLELLGAGRPQKMEAGTWTLESISEGKEYLILENPADEYEFFLFECRTTKGWDTYIGGSGLAIYHIDMTDKMAGWSDTAEKEVSAVYRWNFNEVNCNPMFQCADMIETVENAIDIHQAFYPYKGRTSFTVSTTPAFVFNDGTPSPYSISDISFSGGKVTFTVYDSGKVIPEVTELRAEPYQDAVILTWESDVPDCTDTAVVSWGKTLKEAQTYKVAPYEPGRYSFTAEGLSPSTAYQAGICFRSGPVTSENVTVDLLTKASQSNKRSYIYLDYLSDIRTEDGKFHKGTGLPLRVYNAVGDKVVWEYSGKAVETDASGYFHPQRTGTLKAKIHRSDGSVEIISKQIILAE